MAGETKKANEKKMSARKRRKLVKRYRLKDTGMGPVDFWLLVFVLILTVFGIVMVFSASYYSAINASGNPYSYLLKQLFFAFTGGILMFIFALIDYHKYDGLAKWMMLLGILLLLVVLTPAGTEIQGAKRWIDIGFTTIMPGEFVKICVIVFVAWWLGQSADRVNSLTQGIIPMLLLAGICGGLIMLQPNMSTAITVVGIIFMMMFAAGLKKRYVVGLIALSIAAAVPLVFSSAYRMERLMSFTDPFAQQDTNGYQVVQSLYALGSGGMFGNGLGNSVEKSLYLPEPQNDFILAVIGEELGYLGIIILMLVYIALIWRGIKIAMDAPDRFGMLIAAGITMMIGIQVVMNIAVVTSSMPPTGVTLPFVSYGGNALWLFMGSAGILLNVSRHNAAGSGASAAAPRGRQAEVSTKAGRERPREVL